MTLKNQFYCDYYIYTMDVSKYIIFVIILYLYFYHENTTPAEKYFEYVIFSGFLMYIFDIFYDKCGDIPDINEKIDREIDRLIKNKLSI